VASVQEREPVCSAGRLGLARDRRSAAKPILLHVKVRIRARPFWLIARKKIIVTFDVSISPLARVPLEVGKVGIASHKPFRLMLSLIDRSASVDGALPKRPAALS